jgi:hypothetical protein
MSATEIDCPVVDAARPSAFARVEWKAAIATIALPQVETTPVRGSTVIVPPHTTTVFERHTPLRI